MLVYRVDVDGVLCTNTDGEYHKAKPLKDNIAKINQLFDDGHRIEIWTARGTTTGTDWRQITRSQLALWGVKYHRLHMGKPHYDCLIDDKSQPAP